jgi:hypothetical protein
MIQQVRINGSYSYRGEEVTVVRRQTNPWMPKTVTVYRKASGETEQVFLQSFRRHASESLALAPTMRPPK